MWQKACSKLGPIPSMLGDGGIQRGGILRQGTGPLREASEDIKVALPQRALTRSSVLKRGLAAGALLACRMSV